MRKTLVSKTNVVPPAALFPRSLLSRSSSARVSRAPRQWDAAGMRLLSLEEPVYVLDDRARARPLAKAFHAEAAHRSGREETAAKCCSLSRSLACFLAFDGHLARSRTHAPHSAPISLSLALIALQYCFYRPPRRDKKAASVGSLARSFARSSTRSPIKVC